MLATHKGEIPFFILIIPFLLGLGLGWQFQSATYLFYVNIAFALLVIIFIGLNFFYGRLKLYKMQWLGGLLVNALLVAFGWLCMCGNNELNKPDHFASGKQQYLLVRVNNEPALSGQYWRLGAAVLSSVTKGKPTASSGNLLINLKDSAAAAIYYGDELLIPANYQAIEPPYNPAEFNYKQYLANQNIHYQCFLFGHRYAVVAHHTGNPLVAYALRLRQRLVAKFKNGMHDKTAIAVASTLILGYKADLSNDVLQAYSKTGTIHVLSVSGAHVAIIYVLLNLMVGFLDRYRWGKIVKAFITVSIIWYYSLLSGFSPAVCRAAVMISMVIIGKTYNRHINTLNILAFSAFFLLIYNPLFIADVGFQLSYLAVFGLIVFQPLVYDLVEIRNKWMDKLWALLSVSIAAQVITFPLSAFYFHQFPVYFLISNLFILIPSAVVMYSGIAYLLLPQIPYLSKLLAMILEQSILVLNKGLALIEFAPFSGISKIWITPLEDFLLYLIIIGIFYFIYNRKIWVVKASLFITLIFCLSISLKRLTVQNSSTIAFLNVRSHTAIIFKNRTQATVMTDLADTDKLYRYSVQPFLDSCKVDKPAKVGLKQDLQNGYLRKSGNIIVFGNERLLIFDKALQGINLRPKFETNYIFITGNPQTDVPRINKNFVYGQMIVDANNANALVTKLKAQAQSLKIKCTVLKRNKSLLLVSN